MMNLLTRNLLLIIRPHDVKPVSVAPDTETDEKKLDNENINYLSISPQGKKIIFNNYKTDIKYGQQVFKLSDPELNKIINNYISMKKPKEGNYLLSLETNKNEPISQDLKKLIFKYFFMYCKPPIRIISIPYSKKYKTNFI